MRLLPGFYKLSIRHSFVQMKMEEQRGMIRDMLMAVRVAQAFKEEAEAEAARLKGWRSVHL